jgi:hypothetical protein
MITRKQLKKIRNKKALKKQKNIRKAALKRWQAHNNQEDK